MKKCKIIAEAGVNHNGDLVIAKELISAAAEAKADYIKFQSFKVEKLVSKSAVKADYQIKNTANSSETQFQMLKKLELSIEDHHELIDECKKYNIKFLSTAFDHDGLIFLKKLGLDFLKSPSGELTNLKYLKSLSSLDLPVVLSTGMAYMNEIENAIEVLIDNGMRIEDITVLHCNTQYPTPFSDVNLLAMVEIGKKFGCSYGYSDHTLGIEVPTAAVALGASFIEKHFTLSRKLDGPDHKASLEPNELIRMVSSIRNIEVALGNCEKKPSPSEIPNISIARKSLHILKSLKKGDLLEYNNMMPLRPGDGISPMLINELVNKRVKIDLPAGHKLSYQDFIN